jgi:NDP-sugar pyrophosphorylase family protein
MKALVLAAGHSTRIASVSGGAPKPLLEVAGKPVLARTLEWLAEFGITDVCINLHYRPDDIRAAIGDGSRLGVRVDYAFEPEILGTSGAFRGLAPRWTDTTLVVYGDNLMRFDLDRFRKAHRDGGSDATVALFDPERHRNSRIAGSRIHVSPDGLVSSFSEGASASTGYVNAGAYLLEPRVVNAIPDGFSDFGRDVFPALVAEGRLRGYLIEGTGYCLGLDTPESHRNAEQLISSKQVVLT